MTMITLDRPKRATASLPHIADWWAEHAPLDLPELRSNWIGWGEPFCFACGWLAPVRDGRNAWSTRKVASWLDRAHLVDHCQGGGGQPDNLVPLCHLCHDEMPPFGPGQRAAALAWVTARKACDWTWQLWTDETQRKGEASGCSTMLRARVHYLDAMAGLLRAPDNR